MNIAILGYGRMGKTIEKLAVERGHNISSIVDNKDTFDLKGADVAIDFSIPDAAFKNITSCIEAKTPVVSGTTGWLDRYDDVVSLCEQNDSAFLYASNFSVGVNIFFELNKYLAKMMAGLKDYNVALEETHHIHKLDAPSGTAITLAEGILEHQDYSDWILDKQEKNKITIQAKREGEVPGTHNITYTSEVDQLCIEHKASNRYGFALGAIIAAEWIKDKSGVFSMRDVLNL